MNRIIFLAALTALSACSNENSSSQKADSANVNVIQSPQTISDVQPFRPNIELTPWDGDLYDAIYWRDSRGENAYIVSGRPQYFWEDENPDASKFFPKGEDKETLSELTEIFGVHYLLKSGESKWNLYYRHHDFLFGCCDVWMEYQPSSLSVADADSNGTGEVIFMYNETEADGKIEHNYIGTMIMEKDSVVYEIQDETGLGEAMRREKLLAVADKITLNTPTDSIYSKWMLGKWEVLWNEKVEQDREEVTDRNNVDEHGHSDHDH